ncbi:renal dipeptidase [Xylaria bambusicola]|uniref:renal dipeptidase n=1 Tax=Xylaria bambusicola TaxID=326684 RepID=UPI0020075B5D|nr:renal dipeptidase [Xylaria bambusicola]KAI0516997.1 renal dipeptidase [Xylaria bambusicola]
MMTSNEKCRDVPALKPMRRAYPYLEIVVILSLVFVLMVKPIVVTWMMKPADKNVLFQLVPFTDGHIDFPIWIRAFYQNRIYQNNFTNGQPLFGQVDFPRLKEGKLGTALWSVYVECPGDENSTSDEVYYETIHDTMQQIDLVYRLIKEYPDYLEHAYSAADVEKIFRAHKTSRISSLMGVEGLHQIGNSASILRIYHALGVRYASLTHTCHNSYADSEEPAQPLHGGLSEAGKAMVAEMNRLGMIADLSHTSFDTQRDVLRISVAPVIFSHSNSYHLYNHTRNVPDDVLESLKNNHGVIMVTFYPQFLGNDSSKASLGQVVDHIQYIGEKIGYEHVGIGSDFDGMESGPSGLEDVSKYPELVAELQRRGLGDAEVLGIMGHNFLRVFKAVELVAHSKQHEQPLEDVVKPFFAMTTFTGTRKLTVASDG